MEQPVTYQQLLAEQYADNATQLLAFQQTEYDHPEQADSEYTIDPYAQRWSLPTNELKDPHAFQEFAGNRNDAENLIRSNPFDDKSKLSIRYNKDVKTNVFSIDSKFRAYYLTLAIPNYLPPNPNAGTDYAAKTTSPAASSVSHFVVRLSKQVKNAITIKLTSFEMPNKFFNISAVRGNNSFVLSKGGGGTTTITVSDSYYTNTTIVSAINTAIISSGFMTGGASLTFSYDATQNKIIATLAGTGSSTYTIDFSNQETDTELYSTLGQMLGFATYTYENGGATKTPKPYTFGGTTPADKILTAEFEPDLNIDTYIYLRVNDYSTVIPQTLNDTYYTVFAKIPVVVDKGQIVYDTVTENTTMKLYHFLQPTNVQQLEIQLLDGFGNELQFDPNINFSMTIEIEEVISQSLYEKMREL